MADGVDGRSGGCSGAGCFILVVIGIGLLSTCDAGAPVEGPDQLTVDDVLTMNRAMQAQTTPPRDPGALVQPAPLGIPADVARREIRKSGHESCDSVASAERLRDGSIRAWCKNGEGYRISTLKGGDVLVVSCTAALSMEITGTC